MGGTNMATRLVLFGLVAACAAIQDFLLLPYEEDYEYQRNCFATMYPPTQPDSLLFCTQYNTLSCCPPVQDQQNLDYFSTVFASNGLSCQMRGDLRDHPLAKLYCMNCNPKQPRFVRNLPYFPLMTNQEYTNGWPLVGYPSSRLGADFLPFGCFDLPSDGSYGASPKDASYDINNYVECYATRRKQILLSKTWMVSAFTIYPHVMSIFETCMMQKSAPCLDSINSIMPNRARFTCGNDPYNPGPFAAIEANPPSYTDGLPGMCALNGFNYTGIYPGDDNCRILYLEKAINTDDLGTPNIAENFGFRIVEDRYCTDDEIKTWITDYKQNLEDSFVNSSTIYLFNPYILNGPGCLMRKHHVINVTATFAWPPVNLTADWVQDELCFSAASSLSSLSFLAVLLFCLSLAWAF